MQKKIQRKIVNVLNEEFLKIIPKVTFTECEIYYKITYLMLS